MTSSPSETPDSLSIDQGETGEENEEDNQGVTVPVENRRLFAATVGLAVYVFFAFTEGGTGRSYTFHTIRYVFLVSGIYTLISGINTVWMYIFEEGFHGSATNLAGGLSTTVGIGLFHLEVLVSDSVAPDPAILLFSAVFISVGMLLILKIDL